VTADLEAKKLPRRISAWLDAWRPPDIKEHPIGVAVSGGGDSLALLRLVTAWARENAISLHVLTVDHGLRTESADETEFVARLAGDLDWPCDILRWSNGQPSARKARLGRHTLLAEACAHHEIAHVMLGHTLDDQIETFLMRARQGSGWYGLAGMDRLSPSPAWPEGRGLTLVRPLLEEKRGVLRDWLVSQEAEWVDDPTNQDESFERVRMRALLRDHPLFAERISRMLPNLAALRQAEQAAIADVIETRVTCYPNASIDFDPTSLRGARAIRTLGWLVQAAAGKVSMPREAMLAEALAALQTGKVEARTLAGAWLVAKPGGVISIYRDPGAMAENIESNPVFDGRFEKAPARESWQPRDWRAGRSLPSGDCDNWIALTGTRLAHLCSIWRQLPSLSHVKAQ